MMVAAHSGLPLDTMMNLFVSLPVGIVEREVTLMHEHGVDDDLLGHLQKLLVEGGDERLRVLGEVDHLEQRLRGKVGGEAGFGLDGGHALADDALALGLRGDHVGGADDVEQVRGGIHRVLAGSQHAMAHGEVSRTRRRRS